MAWPGDIESFTTKIDGVTDVLAEHVNTLQTSVVSLETAIGQEGNTALCEGRLTGTTGVPVTTADLTTITSLKYTPFNGSRIALHNGTGWITHIFTELSLAVPNTTNTMYDVFIYDNAGTLTLEALAWTNDTTRATALTTLDGVLVKTGATTRRYLGSFRTTGASSNTADSVVLRYVWNYYNRAPRPLLIVNSTSHTYNTATIRPYNNDQGNSYVQFITGVLEAPFLVTALLNVTRALTTDSIAFLGIGLSSTTTVLSGSNIVIGVLGQITSSNTMYTYPVVGYNYLCLNETVTVGSAGATYNAGVLKGIVWG